jgi:TM2 domain-containing membrane protein YozV
MEVKDMANAILAAILSLLIPGLGQAYAGDVRKGVIFFVILLLFAIIGGLIFKSWLVWLIELIYAIYAAYDAYQMAQYG